jgi:hypothetical protein
MLGYVVSNRAWQGAALRSEVAAEMGERALRTALDTGVFKQIWRGVIVHAADLLDPHTRAAAALLAVGQPAVLSGPTALAMYGMTAAECLDVHVLVPRSRSGRSKPGLVVHRGEYHSSDVVELDDLPVLALDLALADFLCDGDKRIAFASFDQALAKLSASDDGALRASIAGRIAQREDRRGANRGLMLTNLGTGKADSPPESVFRLILAEAGFPIPEPQFEIPTVAGRQLYVLDMAWPELRIAFEYDGYAAHEERKDYDAMRDERLARRGWIVVRAGAADLADPSRVLRELRAAFAKRSR